MKHAFFQGLLVQASLIFVLGAQNVFVLECGLKRQSPLWVATLCALCDTVLILIGTLWAARWLGEWNGLKIGVGIVGTLFLGFYAVSKAKEGFSFRKVPLPSASLNPLQSDGIRSLLPQVLGFSLLNPHAYLDAFVLLGSLSASYSETITRLLFGLGAITFSWIWFYALIGISQPLRRLFNSPKRMRILSFISAGILFFMTFQLGWTVKGWIDG